MLIGELAERSVVPAKTIRYYEVLDILPPARRTVGGYRDYDDAAVDRLRFVRAAQAAGLTLAEIRNVVALRDDGIAPCSHVIALLDDKAAAGARQIASLRSCRRISSACGSRLTPGTGRHTASARGVADSCPLLVRQAEVDDAELERAPELLRAQLRRPSNSYPLLKLHNEGVGRLVWTARLDGI
ncbi:MAG TPA: MerR family transcriptional regulator [Acidimicrobiales bacterium]|nr:MerR family transcriptional regulator [Acidimicrobiales bacterium]